MVIDMRFIQGFMVASSLFIAFIFYYEEREPRADVYVNVDKVITEITAVMASKNLSDIEAANAIRAYKLQFDSELNIYAKEHKVIIFSSPKPLKGALDKTDYFVEKLKKDANV